MGPAWSDARVLAYGYAFEQALGLSQKPGFPASVALPAAGESLFAP
jgi:amidase